ncbi:right-handed parallel beta-helix repeat-containing protein [Pendulispora albinea]|uniref:DUF1565 domain-containing protein n=1 Tax=Pendulispora albinea TaxID=2741071 RepID=A0ABZ2MBF8_9BACT
MASTSTELTFTLPVPHGAPIGSQPLNVTTAAGQVTIADAVTITAITAAPSGEDARDVRIGSTGTDERPLRSLAKAASLARAGDTIFLKDGIYDEAHGETFGAVTNAPFRVTSNVPADVTIKGESVAGTKIMGPGSKSTGVCGLVPAGNVRIETLDISGFDFGVFLINADGAVKNVSVHACTTGLRVEKSATETREIKFTLDASRVYENTSTGISSSGLPISVADTEIDHNGAGQAGGGPGIEGAGGATLTGVNIQDNAGYGYRGVQTPSPDTPLVVTNSSFVNNSLAAIVLLGSSVTGSWSVKIRDSRFIDNNQVVLVNVPFTQFDLGTENSHGMNQFTIRWNGEGIVNARNATSESLPPIRVFGNTWTIRGDAGSAIPPSGCSNQNSPSTPKPPYHWRIDQPGTCLSTGKHTGNVIVN